MKRSFFTHSFLMIVVGVTASMTRAETPVLNTNITLSDIEKAQKAWGAALIQISSDYAAGGFEKAKATSGAVLDAAYGYNLGPVRFKPTLAVAPQTFRPTWECALAYFVGGNKEFPNDSGNLCIELHHSSLPFSDK